MTHNIDQLYCPHCHTCNKDDERPLIIKNGHYKTTNDDSLRQRFLCIPCGKTFSEKIYSELYRKGGSYKEFTQTAKLASYGLSTDAIADVLERDRRTIQVWIDSLGVKSHSFHIFVCTLLSLTIHKLQMDEIWSYVCNKSKQLWLFAGIDPDSKLLLHIELGSRTKNTALKLVAGISKIIGDNKNQFILVTTDKLSAYVHALKLIFKDIDYSYLQIVKKRYKMKLVTVSKTIVKGVLKDFYKGTQNTSFIERINLTLRMRISYLQRKTIGYCKKKDHFMHIAWINLLNYNYIKFHKGLRLRLSDNYTYFKKSCSHYTPAMKAGLTDKALDWRFIITCPVPSNINNTAL